MKVKNKEVRVYAKPGSERCLVTLLDTYLTKLPTGCTYLYVYAATRKVSQDKTKPRQSRHRVGVNKLKEIFPRPTTQSGLEKRYTSHSLRATAMTWMFNGGVPEKISRTQSLEALHCYKHTSKELGRAAGNVIIDP